MITRHLESGVKRIKGITLKYVNRIDLSPYNVIFKFVVFQYLAHVTFEMGSSTIHY